VAGEDLGVVPDYVRPEFAILGIAGFKIPQWEMRDGMIIPGEMYDRLSVATYATHDHEPIRALWDDAVSIRTPRRTTSARDTREDRSLLPDWIPKSIQPDYEKDFYPAVMDALFRCNSWIAMS
jgi:4-alpha-glucanotransferase